MTDASRVIVHIFMRPRIGIHIAYVTVHPHRISASCRDSYIIQIPSGHRQGHPWPTQLCETPSLARPPESWMSSAHSTPITRARLALRSFVARSPRLAMRCACLLPAACCLAVPSLTDAPFSSASFRYTTATPPSASQRSTAQ